MRFLPGEPDPREFPDKMIFFNAGICDKIAGNCVRELFVRFRIRREENTCDPSMRVKTVSIDSDDIPRKE